MCEYLHEPVAASLLSCSTYRLDHNGGYDHIIVQVNTQQHTSISNGLTCCKSLFLSRERSLTPAPSPCRFLDRGPASEMNMAELATTTAVALASFLKSEAHVRSVRVPTTYTSRRNAREDFHFRINK